MNLKLRFFRVDDTPKNRALVKEQLAPVFAELPVDRASLITDLEHREGGRVYTSVHLEVPGPDIRASAFDYTLEASLRKLRQRIDAAWKHRLQKRRAARPGPRLSAVQARA